MRKLCILLVFVLLITSLGCLNASAGGDLTTQRYDIEEAKKMADILSEVSETTSWSQDMKIAQLECFSTIVAVLGAGGTFDDVSLTSLNDEAIAGILANLDRESKFDPYITESAGDYFSIYLDKAIQDSSGAYKGAFNPDKSGGVGIAQWTNGRRVSLSDWGKTLYNSNPGNVRLINSTWYKAGKDNPESITNEVTYTPSLGYQVAYIFKENHALNYNRGEYQFGEGIWDLLTHHFSNSAGGSNLMKSNTASCNGNYWSYGYNRWGDKLTYIGSGNYADYDKVKATPPSNLTSIYTITTPQSSGSDSDRSRPYLKITTNSTLDYETVTDYATFNPSDEYSYKVKYTFYESIPKCQHVHSAQGMSRMANSVDEMQRLHGDSLTEECVADYVPVYAPDGSYLGSEPVMCNPEKTKQYIWSETPTTIEFSNIENLLQNFTTNYSQKYKGDYNRAYKDLNVYGRSLSLSGAVASSIMWTISWEMPNDKYYEALLRGLKADKYFELITTYDWTPYVNLEEAVIAAQQLSVSGYWTSDQLSAFSKMMELDLSVLLDNATRENLSAEFLKELSAWEDNIEYNKQDTTFTAVLRKIVSLVGILFIVWAILLYIAYWFDRINTIVPVNAVTLLTLGKLRLSDDERSCTYGMFDDTGKKAFKTVNHVAIVMISITALAFGVVLVSGYIYSVIGYLVRFMTSFFK